MYQCKEMGDVFYEQIQHKINKKKCGTLIDSYGKGKK